MKLPLDIERELIRKLINGDKIAFSHLFSFYKSQVLYYCVHFVKDKEIAEDITQDIFLTVWEKKEDIRIEQSFSAFFYTIARNRIYDIFRSLSARSVLYEKLMEQAIDYVDDVEKSLEEKNIQELIAQALEQLSPRQREIFELSRNRGLSHKEIAEQLGLSVYTVQDHIKNALEKIRAYLIPFISTCPILVSLIILKYVKP